MQHRIRRQILELDLPREEGAADMARRASLLFQQKVLPELDRIFSEIAPADRYIQISRLEIDLEQLDERNFETNFVDACIKQISQQIQEVAKTAATGPNTTATLKDASTHALAIFEHFIGTGALPWFAKAMPLLELEEKVVKLMEAKPQNLAAIVQAQILSSPVATQRLVWQFSYDFAASIIAVGLRLVPECIIQAIALLEQKLGSKLPTAKKEALLLLAAQSIPLALFQQKVSWQNVLEWVQTKEVWAIIEPTVRPAARPAFEVVNKTTKTKPATQQEEVNGQTQQKSRVEQRSVKPTTSLTPPEGLPIVNAGMVLFNPYLASFFRTLDVTPVPAQVESCYRAVHLLHYLVTGEEQPEEPALVLPKLLCGLDLEEPVPRELTLTPTEKEESETLLQAVIQNWSALKNTSSDGLRSGFLQRDGLLFEGDDFRPWKITIERKGQDLLLNRLPWSLSVIKLPWLAGMINVEW